MSEPDDDPWEDKDAADHEAWREDVDRIAAGGATCPHCGFYNHADSDVRDAGDNRQHCANCGEMFERTV